MNFRITSNKLDALPEKQAGETKDERFGLINEINGSARWVLQVRYWKPRALPPLLHMTLSIRVGVYGRHLCMPLNFKRHRCE